MPAVTSVAVGAASVGAGLYTAKQSRDLNEDLADDAAFREKQRRKRAAAEMEKATERYNELRAQRPDLTVQDYLIERAEAIGGEEGRQLIDQLRSLKQEDWQQAQSIADAASAGNIKTYDVLLDQVSGGQSGKILAERNQNALQTNEIDAFNRALELRSSTIPAGTVKQDSQGRFVEGQRSDKQTFQTAFEVSEALRDKQFTKLNSILENDRAIALRQQEKALDYLNSQEVTNFLQAGVEGFKARQYGLQALDEQTQLNQITAFQNAAFTDQTKQPQFHQDNVSGELISGGFNMALKGLGGLADEKAAAAGGSV